MDQSMYEMYFEGLRTWASRRAENITICINWMKTMSLKVTSLPMTLYPLRSCLTIPYVLKIAITAAPVAAAGQRAERYVTDPSQDGEDDVRGNDLNHHDPADIQEPSAAFLVLATGIFLAHGVVKVRFSRALIGATVRDDEVEECHKGEAFVELGHGTTSIHFFAASLFLVRRRISSIHMVWSEVQTRRER